VRCPYCGNENPDDHRFCGMCGRAIPSLADTEVSDPVRHRDPEPSSPAPVYTGGIFNLGATADSAHRDLNYLLDDEEPRSHKGLIFFFLLAVALAGGLGYLRWRNGSLPSLRSLMAASKPAPAATPEASTNPANSDTSATPSPAQPPAESSSPATTNPPAGSAPTAAAPSATAPNPAPPAATTPEPSSASSANPPKPADSDAGTPAATKATPAPADDKPPSEASEKPVDAPPASAAPAPSTPPARVPPKPATKPAPKPAPKSPDQVTLGEQYLYGRGVPQNCERGLRYVKPAADQSNTKAMITMGALYATGHCISRDLPTAYRFFALALRSDPENGPLRQNAEMVWKQMTSEERKQAIRLTQ